MMLVLVSLVMGGLCEGKGWCLCVGGDFELGVWWVVNVVGFFVV